ncbi:MAG: hypothetical protein Kow0040_08270 [Thermogutta sp.]
MAGSDLLGTVSTPKGRAGAKCAVTVPDVGDREVFPAQLNAYNGDCCDRPESPEPETQENNKPMLAPNQVMDAYFLDVRSMILEIAAALDRHDTAAEKAASGGAADDPRRRKIEEAVRILASQGPCGDRVERILLLFSDDPGNGA